MGSRENSRQATAPGARRRTSESASPFSQDIALLAAIVDSSDDAIISKDLNGIIRTWNPAAERIFGYTAQEAIGQPVTMLAAPERTDDFIDILEQIRNGKRVQDYHSQRRAKDGRIIDVALTVSPVRDGTGRIVGASKIARDITERKRAERAALESEQRAHQLAEVLDAASDFVGIANLTTRQITYINTAGRQMLGLSAAAPAESFRYQDLCPQWTYEKVAADWLPAALRDGRVSGEAVLLTVDGREIPVSFTVRIHRSPAGLPEFVSTIARDISEAKRTEQMLRNWNDALRESEDHYRHTVELNSQGPWTATADGQLADVSPQWLELTGLTRAQALTSGWLDVSHPEDLSRMLEAWSHAMQTGEPLDIEHRVRIADGSHRWMHTRAKQRRDAAGRIIRWYGNTEDIHERKNFEEALRAALQQIGAIITASPLPIIALKSTGEITLWNPAAERIFGWTAEEVLGEPLPFIPPEKRAEHRKMRQSDLAGSGFTNREIRRQRKDGSPIDLSVSTAPITDDAGQVEGIMSIYVDITERKRLEHEWRESEAKFRALVDQSPMATQIVSVDGRIIRANKAWERLFGLTVEQVADFNIFTDPQLAERGILPYLHRARDGEVVEIPEKPVVPHRGERHNETLWIRASAYPVRDEHGAVREVVLIQEDVTARRRAELELRHTAHRFRIALKNSSISVFEQDRDLTYTWAHNEHPQFGPAVIVGRKDEELNPGPWWDEITPVKRRILATGIGERHEFVIGVNGESVTYDMSLEPLPDGNGEIVGITGSAVDITHLKRIEDDLRIGEEKYRFLTNAMPLIVWVADASGRTEFLNDHWYEYTGAVRETPMSEVWRHVIAPEDFQISVATWRQAFETKQPCEVEFRLRRASDKQYRWHLARYRPVQDVHSRVLKWIGVALDIHDRREAVAALRQSEERFRLFADSIPGPMFVSDRAGRNTYTNRPFQKYTGLPATELLGEGWIKVLHPDDRERAVSIWTEAVRNVTTYNVEYRFRRADGQYRWHLCRGIPVLDPHGLVTDWVGVALDVEEKKQAEAALRSSEELCRGIVEASAEGIWIVDNNTLTTFVNPRMTELLGYQEHELLGRSCFDFIHPDETRGGKEGFRKRRDLGDNSQREYRFIRKDGSIIWLSFVGSPMYDESGASTGVVAMCMNTTERRITEERIRELNRELGSRLAELETLLRVIPVGIGFSHDPECRDVGLNPAAARVFGMSTDNPDPKTGLYADQRLCRITQNGVEIARENLPLQVAARTGQVIQDLEYDVVYKDGTTIPVICSAAPFPADHGPSAGGVVVVVDISERKQMEDALRRANAALEQFAYAAAHDLQEPARNVGIYAQLLGRNYHGKFDAQGDEFLRLSMDSARRMQNLIQDLLSFTRSTDDSDDDQPVSDASVAMEIVLQNLRTAIEVSEAEITFERLPQVAVRQTQLAQLLQNLVANSLKYRSLEPPKIRVSAQRQGREWWFTVRDNGQGIAPEHHERIFRVFKRLHGRDIPGTGIGLSICERIVTHYGGRIWVESEEGKGAAFHFTVPAAGV